MYDFIKIVWCVLNMKNHLLGGKYNISAAVLSPLRIRVFDILLNVLTSKLIQLLKILCIKEVLDS